MKLFLLITLIMSPFFQPTSAVASVPQVAINAESVKPILIGSMIPKVELKTVTGKTLQLNDHLKGKKTLLIFYRGGWCPFCNKQLSSLIDIQKNLKKLGYQIVAISADQPSELKKSLVKQDLGYELLSDSDAKASKAFGIAFQVDSAGTEKLRSFGIDIESASGNKEHILPVPAVFLVNKESKIDFSYVNPNYKIRLKSEIIKAAAREFEKE